MPFKSPYTHATYQAIQFKWTCDYNGQNCNNYDCTKTLTLNNIFPYMKHLATCKSYEHSHWRSVKTLTLVYESTLNVEHAFVKMHVLWWQLYAIVVASTIALVPFCWMTYDM
jgi:hypothetical protein